jgi:hypothetical protein
LLIAEKMIVNDIIFLTKDDKLLFFKNMLDEIANNQVNPKPTLLNLKNISNEFKRNIAYEKNI